MSTSRGSGIEATVRRPEAAERGFTLVEVLVAVLLMGLAMLAIAPLFANSLRSNATGWDYSVLNALAKQRLEELLQCNFNDPRLAVPASAAFDGNPGQLYRNLVPATETVNGVATQFPYELVYVVRDFPSAAIPSNGSMPDPISAVDDANASWISSPGIKMITVIAASSRAGLQGSAYKGNSLGNSLSSTATGKQIRMSAFKAQ